MRKTIIAMATALALAPAVPALGAEAPQVPDVDWPFEGIWGTHENAAAQRGFLVYDQVCASCHSMNHLAYRHLADIGFSEEAIKAIAAEKTYETVGDDGSMEQRSGLPSDTFKAPYANDNEAAAVNGGVAPPDLSLITKARPGGADYLYGLLTGYKDEPPESFWVDTEGNPIPEDERNLSGYYNEVFPGHVIAMPPPLAEGIVSYEGENAPEPTVDQLARDVTHFLSWASEPEMNERKNMGVKVILFLIFLTALLYAIKKKVWRNLEH